jgi:hypothetical protein
VTTTSQHPVKRAWRLLGLKADGDALAFGLVPIVCAVITAIVGEPAIVPVVFLASGGTAAVVARRRGYSRGRSTWYAFVGVLALLLWSFLATPLVESF